jgi:poly(3-hydroxybutyrate) depolymerase
MPSSVLRLAAALVFCCGLACASRAQAQQSVTMSANDERSYAAKLYVPVGGSAAPAVLVLHIF